MVSYKVLQPIEHNAKPYQIGSTVQMEEHEAKPLLEALAIAPLGTPLLTTPLAEDPMVVTQQVSKSVSAVDPHNSRNEPVDPKTAPPSTARRQQQKSE